MAANYGIPTPTVLLNAAVPDPRALSANRPETLRDVLGLSDLQKIVIFQGWISFDRCIGTLVEAMTFVHASIHLVLLGYGDDLLKLRRLVGRLKLVTRVHFLDSVPQGELLRWISSADAGVIPYQPIDENHLYCSPNKLFEFIAANVPIIANDLPYLRSVVADNGFGVVKRLVSPRDYADAINEMFDPASGGLERFRLAIRCGAEPYLWPAQARVLLELYATVWRGRASRNSAIRVEMPVVDSAPAKSAGATAAASPLRIFHGLHNIAGIPSILARAERKLGLASQSICFANGRFGYVADVEEELTTQRSALTDRFKRYADQFDVFVFHFGSSLSDQALVDVPLLKQLGKKIVFYFHGCDIRDADQTIRKYEFSACKVCRPRQCNRNRDLALEMACGYADAIWVSTPDLLEFVPGAELFLPPVELEYFPYQSGSVRRDASIAGSPLLVHAPSSSLLKGTQYLIDAVETTRASGGSLELMLLQGFSHAEVKIRLARADFAVDQLLIGSYGLFAVEAMATGIPVICYLRNDLLDRYPEKPPIVIATPSTIRQVVLDVMNDLDKYQSVTIAARAYVERHHNAELQARRSMATYGRLCSPSSQSPEHGVHELQLA